MKLYAYRLLIVAFFMGLSSCANLTRRSENSGYAGSVFDSAPAYSSNNSKKSKLEDETREELNIYGNDLNDKQEDAVIMRMRLKEAESNIQTKKDRKLYYHFYSYFNSDRERLNFLNLGDYELKERYLRQRGYYDKEKITSPDTASAIEAQDIILGMTPHHVIESWGDPEVREVAGSVDRGNERWKYSKFIPQADGFEKEVRVIYFEHGRVIGWEKLR